MTTPSLRRLPDWQSRLHACLTERRTRPFNWDSQNCVLFVADSTLAITGVDLASAYRKDGSSVREAARLLANAGGMEALLEQYLGEAIAPLCARVGDVGMVPTPHGPAAGVCGGSMWLCPGADGLVGLPIESAIKAWRVG